MFALNFPVEGLQATAWSALLFAGTALVLAVVVAVVLSVLDELLLRRLFHLWAMRRWLDGVNGDPRVRDRAKELQRAFLPPGVQIDASPYAQSEHPFHKDDIRKTFWDLAKPATGMPSRHLLGFLSASVQAEVSNRRPGPFVCWLAAVGSMPILTSPFSDLEPHLRLPTPTSTATTAQTSMSTQGDSHRDSANTSSIQSDNDQDNLAARSALQTYTERALDSLQVRVLRTRIVAWHFAAATLVGALVTLLASQADSPSRGPAVALAAPAVPTAPASAASGTSAPVAFTIDVALPTPAGSAALSASSASSASPARATPTPWSTKLTALLLYVALSAVATAFVAVLAGPLERLAATRNI